VSVAPVTDCHTYYTSEKVWQRCGDIDGAYEIHTFHTSPLLRRERESKKYRSPGCENMVAGVAGVAGGVDAAATGVDSGGRLA
jgi:hypothetical protein